MLLNNVHTSRCNLAAVSEATASLSFSPLSLFPLIYSRSGKRDGLCRDGRADAHDTYLLLCRDADAIIGAVNKLPAVIGCMRSDRCCMKGSEYLLQPTSVLYNR